MNGGKRAIWIAHRRAGKDELALHITARLAMKRPAGYVHMLPLATQARGALWSAVNPHTGKRRIYEAFPQEIIKRELENRMELHLVNGSTWTVAGSDNYQETLIGTSIAGMVFSEWALSDERAHAFLVPILRENDGWQLFISTPRGRNHCYTFYENALQDPSWFAKISTAHETGVFTAETLEIEKQELIRLYGEEQGRGIFAQEYECSWTSPVSGSIWGAEMERAEKEGRIGDVPIDPRVPVHTAWDVGVTDVTAIWGFQLIGAMTHAVFYMEHSQVGLDYYAKELQKMNLLWGQHIVPHDLSVKEMGTGRSRLETLRSLGINARIMPHQSIQDGLNAVRTLLPTMRFDRKRCKRGIECLQNYSRMWDDKRKIFSDRPLHNQWSNGADAARYWAMANVRDIAKRDIVYNNRGIV